MAKKGTTQLQGAIGIGASYGRPQPMNVADAGTTRATEPYVRNEQPGDLVFWGDNNLFPQEVNEDLEMNDLGETVLSWKAHALVGGGVIYGPIVPGPGGVPMVEPMSFNAADDFLEETNFTLYSAEAALDYYRYGNATAELIKANNKVTGIWSQDQSWIRLAPNDRTGAIRKAYLSTEWEKFPQVGDRKRVMTWAALDPYYDVAGQIKDSDARRMLLPLRFQTRGRKYYALAPWNGFRKSKWFDIQKNSAIAKDAILRHLAMIHYHVEVDERYWEKRYPDFLSKPELQKERITKEQEDFEAWISGAKNHGKTLFTGKVPLRNQPGAESYSLWTINELKFEFPKGAFIEETTEADFHMIRAMGVQPSLMGISQSKSQSSAGSGSVNRVDRTNHLLDEQLTASLLLTPLAAAARINEWAKRSGKKELTDRRLGFRFANQYATTLDRTNQVDGQPNQEKQTDDGTVQTDE